MCFKDLGCLIQWDFLKLYTFYCVFLLDIFITFECTHLYMKLCVDFCHDISKPRSTIEFFLLLDVNNKICNKNTKRREWRHLCAVMEWKYFLMPFNYALRKSHLFCSRTQLTYVKKIKMLTCSKWYLNTKF